MRSCIALPISRSLSPHNSSTGCFSAVDPQPVFSPRLRTHQHITVLDHTNNEEHQDVDQPWRRTTVRPEDLVEQGLQREDPKTSMLVKLLPAERETGGLGSC